MVDDGNGGSNYAVSFVTDVTGQITPRDLAVTAIAQGKVYDGTTTATVDLTGNQIAGDTVTLSDTSASFADANVGLGKTVTVTGIALNGADAADYNLLSTTASTTADITARAITVTATSVTKVYDGTTSAAATPTISSGSLVAGDTAAWTESFDTKNAGSGKTLTAAGVVDDGNGGSNYAVSFVTNVTGQITPRTLTVTATAYDKVYDGTTSAAAVPTITSGSLASGDTATWTETFDTKNVGIDKTVAAAGSVNDGNSGSNYAVTYVANAISAIGQRAITVTAATASKVYDGTTSSTATPAITSGSLAVGDSATFSESYGTKNVGTGLTLAPTDSINDGNGGNNYFVTLLTSAAGTITPQSITVTAATASKVYDGTTSSTATPAITSGSLAVGDSATFSESYGTKNVGTGLTLAPTDSINDGNNGNNYAVTFATQTTGQITARSITITATACGKVYDGTTAAAALPTVTSGSLVSGDTAALSETYDTKDAGINKTLVATGSINDGNDGSNYAVTFAVNTAGAIGQRSITVSAAANVKVYDGTTSAAAVPTVSSGNLATGDTAVFAESYDNRNAGTGKTLTASGLVNDDNGGSNYSVTFASNTAGQITAQAITVMAASAYKVYDGTTSVAATPTITGGVQLATGDTAAFTESYDNKNAGTGKTLTLTGSIIDGNGGNNYAVTFVLGTGTITPRAIVVTAQTNTKAYDGTTSAAAIPVITVGSLATGDSATFFEYYSTSAAGTGLTLTPSASINDGNDGNNYSVQAITNTTGAITPTTSLFSVTVTPTTTTAGSNFLVVVTAANASDQTDTGYNGTVTLGSVNTVNGQPGAVPGGPITIVSGMGYGLATLTTAGSWDITATDGTYSGTATTAVTITPAAASQVVFDPQPTNTSAGATMSTVDADVEDQYGNLVTSYTSSVTVSLASGSGTLLGTTTVAATGGVATFTTNVQAGQTGLSIDQAGSYTLSASAAGPQRQPHHHFQPVRHHAGDSHATGLYDSARQHAGQRHTAGQRRHQRRQLECDLAARDDRHQHDP